ncbi:predicted protein [Plenodomus lingam JN3]|uniref:Predicted protein n=1 Tax=Leptosphaeria maculans (strain JN3 / isolate v23.1.3 / race Av1-4-5-6-7-8) TaxID=985895 RepID=E4ZWY2_LEPMJ|nr:predicted protein [Plenodomus lingam JN3]CBX95192.1 predicted protein [Plenodomus lingam JN3]
MYLPAIVLSSLSLLWPLTAADKHQYCACEKKRAGGIHLGATVGLALQCNNKLQLAQPNGGYWIAHKPGPEHGGPYGLMEIPFTAYARKLVHQLAPVLPAKTLPKLTLMEGNYVGRANVRL